jgi:uncharacterized protein YjbI with pentapeptide repeats
VTEDLSHIRLGNSSMTSVELLYVSLDSAVIENSQFRTVLLFQADFSGAVLRGVEFVDCEFVSTRFANAAFINCRFRNCRAEELKADRTTFQGCHFQSFQDQSGVFTDATITGCEFEGCDLDNDGFSSVRLNSVAFRNCNLKNVVFDGIRGTELVFSGSVLHQRGFSGGTFGSAAFEACKAKGVSFQNFRAEVIRIQACGSLEALSVVECTWQSATLTGCKDVCELTFDRSNLTDLAITASRIAYFDLKGSTVSGQSMVSGCQLDGLNLANSIMHGLRMAGCSLATYLVLDGATFDGLSLSGMQYGAGLEVDAAGVTYLENSAQFRVR